MNWSRIRAAASWWRDALDGYLNWYGERVFVVLLTLAACAGLWAYHERIESFAPFAYGVAKVAVFFLAVRNFDTLFTRRFDTHYEISDKQNTAYAVLFGACVIGIAIVLGNI